MQMLLVWNLTEIDVNEPDKVLIVIKVACEYNFYCKYYLVKTVNIPSEHKSANCDREIGVGGGGVSKGGSLTISMLSGSI